MCRAIADSARINARAAAQKDLTAGRKEFVLLPPAWARKAILCTLRDDRDAPVAYLCVNILAIAVPLAVAVFLLPASHVLGAAYLASNYGLFLARFLVALLHVSEHRRLFKPGLLAPPICACSEHLPCIGISFRREVVSVHDS